MTAAAMRVRWSGRPKPASEPLFVAALFVVALIPRIYVALAWSGEPVWDGHYYDFGARRIAAGFGYSDDRTIAGILVWHPWCHYPVGYSAFLAAFYRVFGATHAVAGAANALVGAALAVVTWALARYGLSPARARVAGFLVAVHPGLVLYAALLMSEPLAALLHTRCVLAGGARAALSADSRPVLWSWALPPSYVRKRSFVRRFSHGRGQARCGDACLTRLQPVLWRSCRCFRGRRETAG